MKYSVLLVSPLSPLGGIVSWSNNVLSYMKENNIFSVKHLDSSIRFKTITNGHGFRRFYSAVLDSTLIFVNLMIACHKYTPQTICFTSSASLSLFKDLVFMIIARFYGGKCVFHYHFGRIPALKRKNNWEWKLIKKIVKCSYRSIVIDMPSYVTLCGEGLREKIVYIPNPCSLSIEKIARQPVNSNKNEEFIFVGHVIHTKGVFELVKAFVLIEEELSLTLIGAYENGIKEELLKIAKEKNNGCWLKFKGGIDSVEVLERMQYAKALILPSYSEGFPNVVLEAMACGCPVIATNVGAIPDMLGMGEKEVAGICISPYSIDELCSSIKYVVSKENFLLECAINGKKRILKHYTIDSIFPLYAQTWGVTTYD